MILELTAQIKVLMGRRLLKATRSIQKLPRALSTTIVQWSDEAAQLVQQLKEHVSHMQMPTIRLRHARRSSRFVTPSDGVTNAPSTSRSRRQSVVNVMHGNAIGESAASAAAAVAAAAVEDTQGPMESSVVVPAPVGGDGEPAGDAKIAALTEQIKLLKQQMALLAQLSQGNIPPQPVQNGPAIGGTVPAAPPLAASAASVAVPKSTIPAAPVVSSTFAPAATFSMVEQKEKEAEEKQEMPSMGGPMAGSGGPGASGSSGDVKSKAFVSSSAPPAPPLTIEATSSIPAAPPLAPPLTLAPPKTPTSNKLQVPKRTPLGASQKANSNPDGGFLAELGNVKLRKTAGQQHEVPRSPAADVELKYAPGLEKMAIFTRRLPGTAGLTHTELIKVSAKIKLRKTNVKRSPGGTPLINPSKNSGNDALLSNALFRKFRNARNSLDSPPPGLGRGGGDEDENTAPRFNRGAMAMMAASKHITGRRGSRKSSFNRRLSNDTEDCDWDD